MICPGERLKIAEELQQIVNILSSASSISNDNEEHAAQWLSSLDKRLTDLIDMDRKRRRALLDGVIIVGMERRL